MTHYSASSMCMWSCILLCLFGILSVHSQDLGRSKDDPRGFAYGTYDQTWKFKNRFRYQNRFNHPTHLIVAPKTLRPGAIYRCVVSILYLDFAVDVRASLQKDGVEIASQKKDIIKGYPETLLLQIPKTVVDGNYKLRVEGNFPDTVGGTVFSNTTQLHFSNRFLTILIQANRPVYTGDQLVRFRIILLMTDLKPYDDPVDIYVLDPDDYVMRRWPSRPTNVGVISMSFMLPALPKKGWWKIRAVVNGQIEDKPIKVEKLYTPRFETKLYMQKYFLETDEAISGAIESEFGTDQGIFGNATVRLYKKSEDEFQRENWTYVMEKNILLFQGEEDYEFPMEEVARVMPKLDGATIKVEAEVMSAFHDMNMTGYSQAKIINSSVNCRFIGSPPFVFKPGMPFDAAVAVSYHDFERLSPEKLMASKLEITAEAVTEGGGRVPFAKIIIPQVNAENKEREFLQNSMDYSKKRQDYQAKYPGYKLDDYDYGYDYDYDSKTRFLSEEELVERKLELFLNNQRFQEYREKGVFRFKLDLPDKTSGLTLTASYQDDMGSVASATAKGIAYFSEKKQYIGVETSTKSAAVGDFVIFHIRANFMMQSFNYLIMAKDMILYAGKEVIESPASSTVKTISVPISSEMAPAFQIFIYHMTQHNEILSDSLTVPVDGISSHKVKLTLNQEKDHSLRTVELGTYSTAGAFFGVSGVRHFSYSMQAGNELSHSSVLNSLHGFSNYSRSIHKMTWRDREGVEPETSEFFLAGNYGPDSNRTFEFGGLVVFTDAWIGVVPGYRENICNASQGYSPCLMGGCYFTALRCNGNEDCVDGYDEIGCADPLEDKNLDFRIHQFSRFSDFFDTEDGDWMWFDTNIGYKGHEQNTIELPKVDDQYIVNAFSVSKEHGFGLIPAPLEFTSLPFMYIMTEMPENCRRGEQVGLKVIVHNLLDMEAMIMVILHGSDDFASILVEENGRVDFYAPRTFIGDRQHLLSLDPESSAEVVFPIVATIDQGEIEITVSALTQIGRDSETVSLRVEPEGATISRHTSTLLDLKNRAVVYKYMDIIVEESYIIPLRVVRRFVAGSPRGHVSICGDIVGPSFPNGGPVDHKQMLRKNLRGTEASVFNFGANFWTLNYLRLTNQFNLQDARPIFDQLNVELAAIVYRFGPDGGFKMWDYSPQSVWLTAWATRILQQGHFPDWENVLYIEPKIISKALDWLVKYQAPSGSFMETPEYQEIPLDQKMREYPSFRNTGFSQNKNISLTAMVLITLVNCIESTQGNTRSKANLAKTKAIRYLEMELSSLNDPYETAIVTYALTIAESQQMENAYSILDRMKREENGLVYWSREQIKTNKRVYENNQRNLLQPKFEQKWDAHAVETTSYALLVYLIKDGIQPTQERIVEWLNAMRMHDGGFISTVDTLMAMQALTEYSYRARLRDITDMDVRIEATGEKGRNEKQILITNTTISQLNTIPITNVWGMVNIMARGAGQAILQLDVSYGVDWTNLKKVPPVDAFDMRINERFSKFGNKSIGYVEICARWVNLEESPTSSATVIEVENPTGYYIYQKDAERVIKQSQKNGTFPSIRDVIGGHGDAHYTTTVWFFDYIPGNTTWCFEYQIRRWYPVANMTNVRMATIYEQYQPERFQMVMFNSTTWSLDVCEVCASYQCPYCPAFSSAVGILSSYSVLMASIAAVIFYATVNNNLYNGRGS